MYRTKKKRILWFFLIVCSLCLCSCKKQGTEILVEDTVQEITEEEELKEGPVQKKEKTPTKPASIWVDVSGAVANPGVYELPENARVFEAIETAGGFLEQADTQWLNQALVLKDGEKIQVYTKEETEELKAKGISAQNAEVQQEPLFSSGEKSSGKVNLNTATADRLQEIPGIGEARAKAILEYRQQIGGFQNIEEIQQVPGIKGKIYEKIVDYICVE